MDVEVGSLFAEVRVFYYNEDHQILVVLRENGKHRKYYNVNGAMIDLIRATFKTKFEGFARFKVNDYDKEPTVFLAYERV